jgi:hypothetical protein
MTMSGAAIAQLCHGGLEAPEPRLSARRADEHHQLTLLDLKGEIGDGDGAIGEDLADSIELDRDHVSGSPRRQAGVMPRGIRDSRSRCR